MKQFVPYEKLSKKQKKEIDKARRASWGDVIPVSKKIESAKAYNRKFGYLPIPTAQTAEQAEAGKEMKLLNNYSSFAFVKATINPAKIKLAKEAVSHIVSGDTVFLDASTTTFYIAK